MRRAEHELLRIRSAVAGAQAMEKPPPLEESAHCDVCSFTFRRRHHCRSCGRTLCHKHSLYHMGVIIEDVVELRKSIGAPGMTVLQFAFGGGSNKPYLSHNHELNQVVYTGTHDNDTVSSNYFKVLGWWQILPEGEKQTVLKYLSAVIETDISWALITAILSSVVRTSIVTMQDILGLDSSARMNTPATQLKGNWRWRIPSSVGFDSLSPEAAKLKELLALYNWL